MLGYDITKVEISNEDTEIDEMEKLPVDELKELIKVSKKEDQMVRTLTDNQINKLKMVLSSKDLFNYCQIIDDENFYNQEIAPYLKEICDDIQ